MNLVGGGKVGELIKTVINDKYCLYDKVCKHFEDNPNFKSEVYYYDKLTNKYIKTEITEVDGFNTKFVFSLKYRGRVDCFCYKKQNMCNFTIVVWERTKHGGLKESFSTNNIDIVEVLENLEEYKTTVCREKPIYIQNILAKMFRDKLNCHICRYAVDSNDFSKLTMRYDKFRNFGEIKIFKDLMTIQFYIGGVQDSVCYKYYTIKFDLNNPDFNPDAVVEKVGRMIDNIRFIIKDTTGRFNIFDKYCISRITEMGGCKLDESMSYGL